MRKAEPMLTYELRTMLADMRTRAARASRLEVLAHWVIVLTVMLAVGMYVGRNADAQTRAPHPAHRITEDMPGWDCGRMGNGICGYTLRRAR